MNTEHQIFEVCGWMDRRKDKLSRYYGASTCKFSHLKHIQILHCNELPV